MTCNLRVRSPHLPRIGTDKDDQASFPDKEVFYVFVCRALLGVPVRTLDGFSSADDPSVQDVAASRFPGRNAIRELQQIPGLPAGNFHSLVAEYGNNCTLKRFREIIIFHSEQIYPEYLLACVALFSLLVTSRIRSEPSPLCAQVQPCRSVASANSAPPSRL